MPTPPRRRWFQFGLRTMFVVVTVVAMILSWVTYSLNWIRQRHTFRDAEIADLNARGIGPLFLHEFTTDSPPGLLWIFGERGQSYVGIAIDHPVAEGPLSDAEMQKVIEAKRLFPEAQIYGGWCKGIVGGSDPLGDN